MSRHIFLLLAACGCGFTGCGGDAFSTLDSPIAETGPAETGPVETGSAEANTDASDSGDTSVPDGADAPDSGGAESGPDAAGDAAQDTGTKDAEPDNWQTCVQQACSTGCCPGTFCSPIMETCEPCLSAGAVCNGNPCCSGSCNLSTDRCN